MNRLLSALLILLFCSNCEAVQTPLKVGAERTAEYLPLLKGKRVALVVNQTSVIGTIHLVDSLYALGIDIKKVMAPEHGFRGEAPDGEKIEDSKDEKTGIPIVSIYGSNKKPTPEMLADVDVLLFDIQDVGVRFYTFISTMHYVMEAAAENNKKVIVLDRPNPNGMYIDGPVKDDDVNSFIGMHPIPIVHGLTVGELALMINGESWLKDRVRADLTVINIEGWDHTSTYPLPIKPSPNLPTDNAIALYASLGLFEGTVVSVGRGTDFPFEVIGHPKFELSSFAFTPQPNEGSKYPPLEGEECFGQNLSGAGSPREFSLRYLITYYNALKNEPDFFKDYLTLLAGTKSLKEQIEKGMTEAEIRATWQKELNTYKAKRKQYLLYKDFK
ncbi:MAG: hypothetical protein ACJAXB_002821 [Candidatus Endobugula sp.]|jgi:uncharacterized protein YbbC (DUF1343 family)